MKDPSCEGTSKESQEAKTLPEHCSESSLMTDFLKLQEQRCIAYNTLDRCMKEYRESKKACLFTETMKEITNTFHTVSAQIIQIKKNMYDLNYTESAKLIEAVQKREEDKLRLTAEAHIKQQAVSNYGKEEDEEELRRLKKSIQDCITAINEELEEARYVVMGESDSE